MSKSKQDKAKAIPLTSEQISTFLNFLTQAEKDYDWNSSELERLNKLSQDYLHKLELENLKYKDKCKIGPKLSKVRQQRREHKDSVEILTPIVEFIRSDKGKSFKNLLNEQLGKTRKFERKLGDRIYYFRVLQEPPIKNNSEEIQ